jgi:hypothetical protein
MAPGVWAFNSASESPGRQGPIQGPLRLQLLQTQGKEEGGSQRLPQRRLGDGGVSSREDTITMSRFG